MNQIFPGNPALSICANYCPAASCQVSKEPMTSIREKHRTDGQTDGRTDGQTGVNLLDQPPMLVGPIIINYVGQSYRTFSLTQGPKYI